MSVSAASIDSLCAFFGISRQAYYKHRHRVRAEESQQMAWCEVLAAVRRLRARQPRLGSRKLLYLLKEQEPALVQGIGRDAFFSLLREQELLVLRRKGFSTRTTDSRHQFRKYPDLYNPRRSEFTTPFMAVVADITYIHTLEGFAYAALLTDVASRMVVGADVCGSLCVEGSLRAAAMTALLIARCRTNGQAIPTERIHHSDRGVQYCCGDYVALMNTLGFKPSMTQDGEPTDNALAERVNGIFKDEFLFNTTFPSIKAAQTAFAEAVLIYNTERPHLALNMKTPQQVFDDFYRPKGDSTVNLF
jgi:putative transposase